MQLGVKGKLGLRAMPLLVGVSAGAQSSEQFLGQPGSRAMAQKPSASGQGHLFRPFLGGEQPQESCVPCLPGPGSHQQGAMTRRNLSRLQKREPTYSPACPGEASRKAF